MTTGATFDSVRALHPARGLRRFLESRVPYCDLQRASGITPSPAHEDGRQKLRELVEEMKNSWNNTYYFQVDLKDRGAQEVDLHGREAEDVHYIDMGGVSYVFNGAGHQRILTKLDNPLEDEVRGVLRREVWDKGYGRVSLIGKIDFGQKPEMELVTVSRRAIE